MSNMKHTPEPWRENSQGDAEHIYCERHGAIATIPHGGLNRDEHKANAQRIVACVNAMAGIEEPQAFRDSLKKLVSYADKASEMFTEKDAKIKQLYTAAENLWQTLNAVNMSVAVHLDQDTRKQIKEALANNNPSNYSA